MFQHRAADFDPRLAAITGHLRAIEKELGVLGRRAGRNASATAASAGNQIADTIGPILQDIYETAYDALRRGKRRAADEAVGFGKEAARLGSDFGNDALDRVAAQAKSRPFAALAVAVGIGVLIGIAYRRD